jgi:hypothetical protein
MPIPMPTKNVTWSCSKCGARLRKPRHLHLPCGGEVRYRCAASGRAGKYAAYARHLQHCLHCSPDAKEAIQGERAIDQENRMEVVEGMEEGDTSRTHTTTRGLHLSHRTMC